MFFIAIVVIHFLIIECCDAVQRRVSIRLVNEVVYYLDVVVSHVKNCSFSGEGVVALCSYWCEETWWMVRKQMRIIWRYQLHCPPDYDPVDPRALNTLPHMENLLMKRQSGLEVWAFLAIVQSTVKMTWGQRHNRNCERYQ